MSGATGELPPDGPQTYSEALAMIAELEAKHVGLQVTINSQAGIIGKQRAELEEDLARHPRRAEIEGVVDRWRRATNHPRSRISNDRVKLVADLLKQDYAIPILELAVDGLAAYPYRDYGRRMRRGTPAQRDDQLSTALKSGEAVEKFANLGHHARRHGLVDWA